MGTCRSLTSHSWGWSNRVCSWIAKISVLVLFSQAYLNVLRILRGVNGISWHLSYLSLLLLLLVDLIMVTIFLLLKICKNSCAIIGLNIIIVSEVPLLEVISGPAVLFFKSLLSLIIWETHVHFCVGKKIYL